MLSAPELIEIEQKHQEATLEKKTKASNIAAQRKHQAAQKYCMIYILDKLHISNKAIFSIRLRMELVPLLTEGWELNSTDVPAPAFPECPPTLQKGLERGTYTAATFLVRVLSTDVYINNKKTNYLQILMDVTNANLAPKYAKSKNKIYLPIDMNLFLKYLAMKHMANLAERGQINVLKKNLYDNVMSFIGKNRFKVFLV